MFSKISRRHFLRITAALAAVQVRIPAYCQDAAPSKKLNLAIIGPGGQGNFSHGATRHENIVALCDVDAKNLEEAAKLSPNATLFSDYRKLLEEVRDLDAVCVCTPDHTHAPASVMAMRKGIACYSEKPLAHDVRECRMMERVAEEQKLVTQMGTQIHATDNYRRVVEWVQAGVIGAVTEVHVWFDNTWGYPADYQVPTNYVEPPQTLNWDLWIGTAAMRPYQATIYHPGKWRRWWNFGNGTLGDMACHLMDLPFWALNLKDCLTVEVIQAPPVHPETCPLYLQVEYTFPARGELPPCKLTWYDGGKKPDVLEKNNIPGTYRGVLFIGEKGMICADYSSRKLYPEEKFQDVQLPDPWIPASIGHHNEWLQAIRDQRPENTTCPFRYSGRLSETVLLGTVAYRIGKKLEWDADALRVKNNEAANALLAVPYREGWTL